MSTACFQGLFFSLCPSTYFHVWFVCLGSVEHYSKEEEHSFPKNTSAWFRPQRYGNGFQSGRPCKRHRICCLLNAKPYISAWAVSHRCKFFSFRVQGGSKTLVLAIIIASFLYAYTCPAHYRQLLAGHGYYSMLWSERRSFTNCSRFHVELFYSVFWSCCCLNRFQCSG